MSGPEEARGFGYLDRVVDPGGLDAAVGEEARRLRSLDMPSFRATKQRVNQPAIDAIRGAADAELRDLAA